MQLISSDDVSPSGQSQQIPKKRQVGNGAEFNFCIGEKGCSKIGIWKEVLSQTLPECTV
jgi:hypothetical protein